MSAIRVWIAGGHWDHDERSDHRAPVVDDDRGGIEHVLGREPFVGLVVRLVEQTAVNLSQGGLKVLSLRSVLATNCCPRLKSFEGSGHGIVAARPKQLQIASCWRSARLVRPGEDLLLPPEKSKGEKLDTLSKDFKEDSRHDHTWRCETPHNAH